MDNHQASDTQTENGQKVSNSNLNIGRLMKIHWASDQLIVCLMVTHQASDGGLTESQNQAYGLDV